MMHLGVRRGDEDLAHGPLGVSALDRHHAVVADADEPRVAVADNAVHRHPARGPEPADRLEHQRVGLQQIDAGGRRALVFGLELARVEPHRLVVDQLRLRGRPHGERGKPSEPERRDHRPLVRCRDAHDPVHERQRLEEVGPGHLAAEFGPQPNLVERHLRHRLPDAVAGIDHLQLRVQPAHAVADEHEVAHRRIRPLGIALPHGRRELFAEFGRRLEERRPRGIVEHPGFEPPVKLRPGPQFVDHVEPRALVAREAVDEHHRDPARLVRLEHLEVGTRAAVAEGLEKARDARPLRAVEHVEEWRRQVGREMRPGGADAHGGDLDRVGEVEHRRGVIAGRRTGELLQEVFIAGHLEP